MEAALCIVDRWITDREANYVCVTGVHGIMESHRDAWLKAIHNRAGMVTPDGMPLVWISRLSGFSRVGRVYGPDLMLAACEHYLERKVRHFFYGGAPGVADLLVARLEKRFPGIIVAGTYCPPFRPLTVDEDEHIVEVIRSASPDIVWVGVSTPKQEAWMDGHVERLSPAVLIGCGAAFDFNAGVKRQAPKWIQRAGLEWAFRLLSEPRRLWRRYLFGNSQFILLILLQVLGWRSEARTAYKPKDTAL